MTLELEVRSQRIYRRDSAYVVSDSRKYLRARWTIATPDWDAAERRVMVVTRSGTQAQSRELDAGGVAEIPDTLLTGDGSKRIELGLALVGYGGGGLVITTAPIAVRVNPSGYVESGPPSTLPPDVAQQLYEEMGRLRDYVRERGVTYIPHISESGILTWTNDGGRPNPEPVDIRGPAGGDDMAEIGADSLLQMWQQYIS